MFIFTSTQNWEFLKVQEKIYLFLMYRTYVLKSLFLSSNNDLMSTEQTSIFRDIVGTVELKVQHNFKGLFILYSYIHSEELVILAAH